MSNDYNTGWAYRKADGSLNSEAIAQTKKFLMSPTSAYGPVSHETVAIYGDAPGPVTILSRAEVYPELQRLLERLGDLANALRLGSSTALELNNELVDVGMDIVALAYLDK